MNPPQSDPLRAVIRPEHVIRETHTPMCSEPVIESEETMPSCEIAICKYCSHEHNASAVSPGFEFTCSGCRRTLKIPSAPPSSQDTVTIIQRKLSKKQLLKLDKLIPPLPVDSSAGNKNSDTLIMTYEEQRLADAMLEQKSPKRLPQVAGLIFSKDNLPIEVAGYKILKELDREGELGQLYKAHHKELKWDVSLLLVREGREANRLQIGRLLYEASRQQNLRHPNLSTISQFGQLGQYYYFVSNYVPGHSLKSLLEFEELTMTEALLAVAKLSGFLVYAHKRRITHRGITPAHIIIDSEGEPHLNPPGFNRDRTSEFLAGERNVVILGNPAFMAPEQIDPVWGPLTPSTDIYALGATLYFVLTGQAPFQGERLFEQLLLRDPIAPRKINDQVDPYLETICLKCLAKKPNQRYADCLSLSTDLKQVLNQQKPSIRSPGILRRVWRWHQQYRRYLSPVLITGIVFVSLFCSFQIMASFSYHHIRHVFMAQAMTYNKNQARFITRLIHQTMNNQPSRAVSILTTAPSGWIVRNDGQLAFSDDRTYHQVQKYNPNKKIKSLGHRVRRTLKLSPEVRVAWQRVKQHGKMEVLQETNAGVNYLTLLKPVACQRQCLQCHASPAEVVRAVIYVRTPLTKGEQAAIKSRHTFLIFGLFSSSGVCLLLLLLLGLLLILPWENEVQQRLAIWYSGKKSA